MPYHLLRLCILNAVIGISQLTCASQEASCLCRACVAFDVGRASPDKARIEIFSQSALCRFDPESRFLLLSLPPPLPPSSPPVVSSNMAPNPIPLSPARLAASRIRLHAGESAFREGSATIVMPTASAAFLNPVQEFNRDLSVLAIRAWSEMIDEDMKRKWTARMEKKRLNGGVNGQGGRKRRAKDAGKGQKEGSKKVKAGEYMRGCQE